MDETSEKAATLDVKAALERDLGATPTRQRRNHDDVDSVTENNPQLEAVAQGASVRREQTQEDRSEHYDRRNRNDRRGRNRNRNRGRDRDDNDNTNSSDEISPEELLPIAGILEVKENHAFVRTSGYLPGPNDVYVGAAFW